MPRVPRSCYGTSFFHIIVQGHNKEYIFEKLEAKEMFLKCMLNKLETCKVEILGYCIMDNHAHILLYCENISEMSSYMKMINTQFARYYNEHNMRVGYVFRDRFLSEPIMNQKYLYSCLAYIHMNPVKAKLVNYPSEYIFSSYNDFIYKKGVVTSNTIKRVFDNVENYIDMFIFIHTLNEAWEEWKDEKLKVSYDEAVRIVSEELMKHGLPYLNNKDNDMLRLFLKIFIQKGIGLYQLEKILKIDHRKIKKIMDNPN